MRKKYIIGNWKMNKTAQEVDNFISSLIESYNQEKNKFMKGLVFGIAAPATHFSKLQYPSLKSMNLKVSAQDVSAHSSGAYTGEISAPILKSYEIDMVVVGHSERRQYHHETNLDVNQKAKLAIQNGIMPIICVGETLEQYEDGKSKEVVQKQIEESLRGLDLSKIIVAYEPIWAIGTGKTASSQEAQEMCKFIRSITGENLIIQYGGSVKPANIEELMNQPDIDGALVGGASLEANDFLKLLTLNK
ncbi:triosephosphate isomerase [Mycoplasma testudineum]|uniref:Triosephosphate isomerase n=1 Tax=Mycoplasma testudineum TaxID=244584 RepID=A0A4R6IFY1_9MOLU|nr:triose-phosphate isomerase [Mycoplasma testudineum]OYD26695.1 triose-phosphate isomerase [Mycoplasma testudineum]TDO19825.1 triosephosphate isomerase [Mycoplasma testudineum]